MDELLQIRKDSQGDDHWETIDLKMRISEIKTVQPQGQNAVKRFNDSNKLNQKAFALMNAGQFHEAKPLLEECLNIRIELFGKDHPRVAKIYNNLGTSLLNLNKTNSAKKMLTLARDINVKHLSEMHPETATACHNLAACLDRLEEYATAEENYRRALKIRHWVLPSSHVQIASTCEGLALVLSKQQKFADAENLHEKAIKIHNSNFLKNIPALGDSHLKYGGTLIYQGKNEQAEEQLRKALKYHQQVFPDNHPIIARTYNDLATSLQHQARYAEAEPYYYKAYLARRELPPYARAELAITLINLAENLRIQGNTKKGLQKALESIPIFESTLGKAHSKTIEAYSRVAAQYISLGNFAEAQKWLGKADEFTKNSNLLHLNVDILTAQGMLHFHKSGETDGYQQALAYFTKAREMCVRHYGESHMKTALAYFNEAGTLLLMGDSKAALPKHRTALDRALRSCGENHLVTIGCLDNLATNLYCEGKLAEAETMIRKAVDGFEQVRIRGSTRGMERSIFDGNKRPHTLLACLLAKQGKFTEAWEVLEKGLGRGLWDEFHFRNVARIPEHERNKGQELVTQLEKVEQRLQLLQTNAAENQKPINDLKKQKQKLEFDLSQFHQFILDKHGALAGKVYSLQEIRTKIPPNTALLAWVEIPTIHNTPGEHWACILRRKGVPVWVRLSGESDPAQWSKRDERLRSELTDALLKNVNSSDNKWNEKAKELYQHRVEPWLKHLDATKELPEVGHLVVLPSPLIDDFPIDILLKSGDGLKRTLSVSYATSGTTFAWLQNNPVRTLESSTVQMLALGNPAYKNKQNEREGTAFSLEILSGVLSKSNIHKLEGDKASAAELRNLAAQDRLNQFDIVHIAAHAKAQNEIPLMSELYLSDVNVDDTSVQAQKILSGETIQTKELTAKEILRTWKLKSNLITLEACETGRGPYALGEGYLGFSQSLLLAGSQSVLLSMWEVEDLSTSLLMTRFYQNLLGETPGLEQPLPKAVALAEAKNWLRNLTSEKIDQYLNDNPSIPRDLNGNKTSKNKAEYPYKHPYYWAAFRLVGDPGDVSVPVPDLSKQDIVVKTTKTPNQTTNTNYPPSQDDKSTSSPKNDPNSDKPFTDNDQPSSGLFIVICVLVGLCVLLGVGYVLLKRFYPKPI